ncbi:MAG: hypothetical protein WCS20_07645 [Alphaproteobacteria bacterium]|jgi:hypothetical protein
MGILQDLTEALARDTMKAMDELGDDRLYERVAKVLLDMSPTTQEAFMTAMRALLAERKGRAFLEQTLKAQREDKARTRRPARL